MIAWDRKTLKSFILNIYRPQHHARAQQAADESTVAEFVIEISE